ncbi:MAG TPA: L,D-transpeptidase [Xanthobacteraceae bacterium]|jgi:lipoprotein-anchoring transpeptidase ErfK/SrfK|nr:L,D-transpeptidase [Xanthobacteraceae bacterium]
MPARSLILALLLFLASFFISPALALDADQINSAVPTQRSGINPNKPNPFAVKVQILLDRAHFSPGEIDGKAGENVSKALTAFVAAHGMNWTGNWNDELWQALITGAPTNLFIRYTVIDDDVKGPFLPKLPSKMEKMKHLPALSYTSAKEKLAERFHISEDLLSALNPEATFNRAGESLVVPDVLDNPLKSTVARIVVDKSAQTVEAFDTQGQMLAFYPATVGSEEKPAPSGRLEVTLIRQNPTYRYNPKYHFKGVKTRKPFTIKPGPNNPVGVVWIGLSREGYGIHGTSEPSNVSKTTSHGCIRLTNWDALQLAAAVGKETSVDFVGQTRPTLSRRR